MAGNPVQEFVVTLGTQIDNDGVNKILQFFDSSKFKALSLTAAISGLSTAIYKMVESATKREFELERMAKQQSKSIALVRAENSALKAMGKSLAEINKDANLKKIYEDVVKFNKELAFPNISDALRRVEGLQTSFYKLKSTLGTAIQWINAQILTNLEAPIQRLDGYLTKGATWMRDNMGRYSSKIALFVSDFAKGVFGIAEGVGKIFDWLGKLPDGIKSVGAAVAGAFAFVKGGTVGRLLLAIETIGDFMHDYDNWQKNKTAGTNIPVAFGDVYEILGDQSLNGEQKASKVATTILQRISKALNSAFTTFNMNDLFGNGSPEGGGLIGGIIRWFDDEKNRQALTNLGNSIVGFFVRGVKTVGGTAGGAAAKIIDAIFDTKTLDKLLGDPSGKSATAFAGSLGGFINGVINGIKEGKPFHEVFMGSLTGGALSGLLSAVIANAFDDEGNLNENFFSDMAGTIESVGTIFLDLLKKGIESIEDIGGTIFTLIGEKINEGAKSENGAMSRIGKIFSELGDKDSVLGKTISVGVAGWFTTGSFLGGIVSGIGEALNLVLDPKKGGENARKLVEEIRTFISDFGEFFAILWDGEVVNPTTGERSGGMLHDFFRKLWEGEDGEGGMQGFFNGIAEKVGGWLEPVGNAIVEWASGVLDNLWIAMYNGMPDWLKTGMEILLGRPINNPNKSEIVQDEDGNYQLKSTNKETVPLTKEQADLLMQRNKHMEEREGRGILDQIYAENGAIYFNSSSPHSGGKVMDENGEFTEAAAAWLNWYTTFNQLDEAKETALFNERRLKAGGEAETQRNREANERVERLRQEALARESGGAGGGQAAVNAEELAKAENALIALMNDLGVLGLEDSNGTKTYYTGDMLPEEKGAIEDAFGAMYKLSGGKLSQWSYDDNFNLVYNPNNTGDHTQFSGAQRIQQQSEAAAQKLGAVGEAAANVATSLNGLSGKMDSFGDGSSEGKSWGGRIASRGRYEVAEDGAEYIVPITKPERAMQLINQMLSEMGIGALDGIRNDFGVGPSASMGTFGGSIDSLLGSLGGNTNVSAPINIYVTATGSDAKAIGQSAYDAAERHLVKTLRGVYA